MICALGFSINAGKVNCDSFLPLAGRQFDKQQVSEELHMASWGTHAGPTCTSAG